MQMTIRCGSPKLKEKINLRGKSDLKFSLLSYAELVCLSDTSLLIRQRLHIKMQEVKYLLYANWHILTGKWEHLIGRGTWLSSSSQESLPVPWHNLDFQLNAFISLPCLLKKVNAYGAKDKHLKEKRCQMSLSQRKSQGPLPPTLHIHENLSTALPLFLPMVWTVQVLVGHNSVPIDFTAGWGWGGEVGGSTSNTYIEKLRNQRNLRSL